MTLVFVTTEKNEYLIPFMSQKVDGIENGNVYKVNDFFDYMSNTYDEEHIIENPKENGGVPYKVGDNSSFQIFGFVLAIIVLLSSLAGVVILKMKEVRDAI